MFVGRTTNNLSPLKHMMCGMKARVISGLVCHAQGFHLPFRPVISTNGCAYKTLAAGKMTRILLSSLFLLFVHVCACARACVRVCVCEISLTFFLLPVRNVKCWFCVLFVFEAVFQVTWMTLSFWSSCLAFWVLGLQVFITVRFLWCWGANPWLCAS